MAFLLRGRLRRSLQDLGASAQVVTPSHSLEHVRVIEREIDPHLFGAAANEFLLLGMVGS